MQNPKMKTFQFDTEELLQEYPNKENVRRKCNGCNWEVSKIYVHAATREVAEQLILAGEAGLCGDCYSEMLSEED